MRGTGKNVSKPAGKVTFNAGIGTRLRRVGRSLFVLVRLDHAEKQAMSAPEDVARATAAMEIANSAVPTEQMVGTFTTATARGVAVGLTGDPAAKAGLREWLTQFTEEMGRLGLTGNVGPTHPAWRTNLDHLALAPRGAYPASFVGYRVTGYTALNDRTRGWNVKPDTTRRVGDHFQTQANSLPERQTWASLIGSSVPIATGDTGRWIGAASAHGSDPKMTDHVLDDGSGFHEVSLSNHGQCVAQSIVPNGDWRALLEAKRNDLLAAPEAADVGMIKSVGFQATSWSDADLRQSHRTVLLPIDFRKNRHLWDQYVIDAAGINLLTSQHLSHAHNLDDWTLEEVAPDRFLVSARDLEPWFGRGVADQQTIARARDDFGDMILGWDTILANPGPYTSTNPETIGRTASYPY